MRHVGFSSDINLQNISPPFLGVHGGYDILNGSRDYKDWCKKSKFLNRKILGICEKNTLSGALKFQLACFDFEIIFIHRCIKQTVGIIAFGIFT